MDVDANYGKKKAVSSIYERYIPFAERAREEIASCNNQQHKFITVYSKYFVPQDITNPEKTLNLCLTATPYVYSHNRRKLSSTDVLAVFAKKDDKLILLWELHRLKINTCYAFLDKSAVIDTLSNIFKQVSIKLGTLTCQEIPCIAWQLHTEDGVFYIPWHNGSIIEDCESFTFEEKPFEEIKKTYAFLRFTPYAANSYQPICC